jgi:hypothetical protein
MIYSILYYILFYFMHVCVYIATHYKNDAIICMFTWVSSKSKFFIYGLDFLIKLTFFFYKMFRNLKYFVYT